MHILFYIMLAAVPQWELNTSLSYVYDVYPENGSSVWCASSGGAFLYSKDSGMGTLYSCPEQLPLPDCRSILRDSEENLWIASGGKGLIMYDGAVWTVYSSFEGIPGQGTVNALAEAGSNVWVGCEGGFAKGGPAGFVPVTRNGLNVDDVYSIAERNDTLWLCTNRGIFTLPSDFLASPNNPDSWIFWPETQDLQLDRIRVGDESIYACGASGALELSFGADSFQYVIDYSMIADSVIVDIQETSQGLLAAGHGIVMRRDGSAWRKLGNGIPSARWPTVLFELDGVIFCGFTLITNVIDLSTTQAGLGFYYLEGDSWKHDPIPGMQCKKTHQMASAPDGRVYVGTYFRGVQAFYPGYGWRSYVEPDGMPNSSQTFAVALDPSNGVWASSFYHGLSWINDNGDAESEGDTILTFFKDSLSWENPSATFIQELDLPNNQPVMLTSQSNGMWGAFRQYDPASNPDEPSGIAGFNGNPLGTMNWAPRMQSSGIASVNVRAVFPISSDSLWIAFETGAGCQLLVHSGDPADDSNDNWYPGSNSAYTTAHGLPSNEVYCFLDVPGIGLIAGTAEGLALWTGSGFSSYMGITGQIKAMSADPFGRIWCLGASGVYRIADGEVSFFDDLNSSFVSSPLYSWEYSCVDEISGGVYFSSEKGLWLVNQSGGSPSSESSISFYPQPFVSSVDQLRVCGPEDDSPVSVDFFRLDGSYAGSVDAESVSSWNWDGSLDGKVVASGVYMVLVTVNNTVYQSRISVVR